MTILMAVLAGWVLLSLVAGVALGRAARLGSGQTRLAGGPSDPLRTQPAFAPSARAPHPHHHHGPAAAA